MIAPLNAIGDYLKITAGYICVVFGQSLFLVGLETSILPIGRMVGGSFAKYNKLVFVLSFGFVFGLLATVAEPALSVLAKQIGGIMPLVNSTLFIWVTGTGIGIGVAIALVRIVKNINIKLVFAVFATPIAEKKLLQAKLARLTEIGVIQSEEQATEEV